MGRIVVIATLVLGIARGIEAQESTPGDDRIAEWFSNAQRAKAAGNLALAESEYRKVIGARPDLAEARSNLGIVYYLQDRCADALAQFRQALRIHPGLQVPLVFSGICHQKAHRYEQAVSLLEDALRAGPAQSEVYLYLALSYSGLGREVTANKWFERFADQNPSDAEAWYQLGASYLRLSSENLKAAGADPFFYARTQAELGELQNNAASVVGARYEQAISLRPDFPNLHWRLARVLFRNGEIEAARSALSAELRLQPRSLPALHLEAEINRQSGPPAGIEALVAAAPRDDPQFTARLATDRAATLSWLNDILEMEDSPDHPASAISGWPGLHSLSQTLDALWKSIASRAGAPATEDDWALEVYTRCRISRDELPLARGQLESIIEAKPGWLSPGFLLGDLYRRLALAAYARMEELDPKGYRTRLIEAETLEAARRDEEAEKAYREVLRLRPEAGGVHYRLCALLLRLRRLPEAISECQRELSSGAYNTQARVALAEAYLDRREPDKAIPLLRRAVEDDPRLASPFLALARAYQMLAQPVQAASAFEKALKLAPDDPSAHYQLAQTYQELGRDAEAEREFAAVRRLRAQRAVPLHATPETSAPPH